MKCPYLSPSRIDLYEACPLRYYARYELGLRGPTTQQLDTGNLIHRAFELYYDPALDIGPEEAFEMAKKEFGCRNFPEYMECIRIMKDTCARYPKEDICIIDTETEFDHTFGSGLTIFGRIDRLDMYDEETLRITDFKTGVYIPSFQEIEEGHQANMYTLWAMSDERFSKISRIQFSLMYVRENVYKTVEIPKERMKPYKEYLEYLYQQILRNNDPQPNLNNFCWNCEYRQDCQLYKDFMRGNFSNDELDKMNKDDNELITIMAKRSDQLKNIASAIKKERPIINNWLIEILNRRGMRSLDTGETVVSVSARKNVSYDIDTIRELADTKTKFRKVFSVKKTEVDNAFADDPDALQTIEYTSTTEYGEPFVTTKLSKGKKE